MKIILDKNGNKIKTALTKVDLKALVDVLVEARYLHNPDIILGADGDTEMCIIKEENYETNERF